MNSKLVASVLLSMFFLASHSAQAGFSFSFLTKPFKRGPNAKANDPEERAYAAMLKDSKSIRETADQDLKAGKINQQQHDAVVESLKFAAEHYKPYYKYNQEFQKMKSGSLENPAVAKEWEAKLTSFCQRQHKSAVQFMDNVNSKHLVIVGESSVLMRRVDNVLDFAVAANSTSDFFCHTQTKLKDPAYIDMLRGAQPNDGAGTGSN